MLNQYIEHLPEDMREAFKAEIARAVIIASKEDAIKFVESNELLKAVNQADLDRRNAEREKNFLTEKVPKLLEAEKLKAQKPEWQVEIEALKKEAEESRRLVALEKQKNRAMSKASELGLPTAILDKFIGLSDEETDEGLKLYAETLGSWRQSAVDTALKQVGSQKTPEGGTATGAITRASLATPEGRKAMLEAAKSEGGMLQIHE